MGLRFPFPPAFGAAIFYLLLKALRDRRRNDFLLCGLVLGLAQHSYTALRFAPLAVIGCVAIALADGARRREPPARLRALVDGHRAPLRRRRAGRPCRCCATPSTSPTRFLFRGASRIASDALDGPPPRPVRRLPGERAQRGS